VRGFPAPILIRVIRYRSFPNTFAIFVGEIPLSELLVPWRHGHYSSWKRHPFLSVINYGY
jgi:hypothetical protein